jgi:transposase-like protein
MPLTNCGHLSLQKSNGRPLCPKCRAPMWSIRVQAEKAADHKQTFQCPRCEHSHTAMQHDDFGPATTKF